MLNSHILCKRKQEIKKKTVHSIFHSIRFARRKLNRSKEFFFHYAPLCIEYHKSIMYVLSCSCFVCFFLMQKRRKKAHTPLRENLEIRIQCIEKIRVKRLLRRVRITLICNNIAHYFSCNEFEYTLWGWILSCRYCLTTTIIFVSCSKPYFFLYFNFLLVHKLKHYYLLMFFFGYLIWLRQEML